MTAAGLRHAACKCGHAKALHPERLEEACCESGCECEEYIPETIDRVGARPGPSPVRPVPDAVPVSRPAVPATVVEARQEVEPL